MKEIWTPFSIEGKKDLDPAVIEENAEHILLQSSQYQEGMTETNQVFACVNLEGEEVWFPVEHGDFFHSGALLAVEQGKLYVSYDF